MKISLIQCELKMADVDTNYQTISENIDQAAKSNPDVIVLPELWNTSFIPDNVADLADEDGQRAKAFLSQKAKNHQVNIVGGSIARKSKAKLYNTAYIYNREGELIAEYDKVHLFSPSGEDDKFTKGEEMVTFNIDGVKCGIITCYDVRFSEWVRMYALEGIQVLFNVAAWPEVRNTHWNVLNRARAIENQMFVACVNNTGETTDGGHFGGQSAIIDPWGEYVVEPDAVNEVKSATIDLSIIKDIRESINVFEDRRPKIYKIK